MEAVTPKKQVKNRSLYVRYSGEPIQALESAIRRHGPDVALILIPASLWKRLVGKDDLRRDHGA